MILMIYFSIAGFINSESDVRYFGEDVPGVSQVSYNDKLVFSPQLNIVCCQSFSEDQTFSYQDDEGTITVLGSPIKFDPPNLNFKERSVNLCLPPLPTVLTCASVSGL